MNTLRIERLKDFEHDPLNNFLSRSEMMEVVKELIAIRKLKGDQVPVAYTDKLSLETLQGNGMACMWKQGQGAEWREQIALFTTPQKPVEYPDTERMDWLCAHVVQVRAPMPYGSHEMFWSQCDSDDCEEHHTKLREQVDAAIEASSNKPV